ncbi:hypothetical protein A3712_13100 [Vibrio sp. HI00D65]|uniref:GNAT family N-acetyltransferase n=1 Tax=Vibrio sp. HI00D65 TaxID=1822216 RepID=UPI0007B89358|nr:GNAT family N-acetyltransferase [Vibrio sp. HI00D65]KZX68778.1 hypothetical protein A3712_13100 [Vibrio sp. HI00D65]
MKGDFKIQLEETEFNYLFDRVALLSESVRQKYAVKTFGRDDIRGFQVGESLSPMNCRIRGAYELHEVSQYLLEKFHNSQDAFYLPTIGTAKTLKNKLKEINAEPLRGWIHGQFFVEVDSVQPYQETLKTRLLSCDEMDTFIQIHSTGFKSTKDHQDLVTAMFKGLVAHGLGEAYVVEDGLRPIAAGFVYFSDNNIAYLATAVTRRNDRNKGAHQALILRRIESARQRGMKYVSATARLNSQSRRNMETLGFILSHTQILVKKSEGEE